MVDYRPWDQRLQAALIATDCLRLLFEQSDEAEDWRLDDPDADYAAWYISAFNHVAKDCCALAGVIDQPLENLIESWLLEPESIFQVDLIVLVALLGNLQKRPSPTIPRMVLAEQWMLKIMDFVVAWGTRRMTELVLIRPPITFRATMKYDYGEIPERRPTIEEGKALTGMPMHSYDRICKRMERPRKEGKSAGNIQNANSRQQCGDD